MNTREVIALIAMIAVIGLVIFSAYNFPQKNGLSVTYSTLTTQVNVTHTLTTTVTTTNTLTTTVTTNTNTYQMSNSMNKTYIFYIYGEMNTSQIDGVLKFSTGSFSGFIHINGLEVYIIGTYNSQFGMNRNVTQTPASYYGLEQYELMIGPNKNGGSSSPTNSSNTSIPIGIPQFNITLYGNAYIFGGFVGYVPSNTASFSVTFYISLANSSFIQYTGLFKGYETQNGVTYIPFKGQIAMVEMP